MDQTMAVGDRQIKTIIMESGERYCLLIDTATGLPLYFPNLYITTRIRNNSLSLATMKTALISINSLLTYFDKLGVSLEARFRVCEFLKIHEFDGIRDFCQRRLKVEQVLQKENGGQMSKVLLQAKLYIGKKTQYSRLTYIGKYTKWLAEIIMSGSMNIDTALAITTMQNGFEARRPYIGKRNQHKSTEDLTDTQVEILLEVIRPSSPSNPFRDPGVQVRNCAIILFLFYIGDRRGELLNICVPDIDFVDNQIATVRRADEPDDPRTNQPLVKTMDYRSPLKDTLSKLLHRYIKNYRSKVPGARMHNYVFVSHKSGPTQGQPMSISALDKMIRVISKTSPELKNFHAHALRHKWNDRFSKLVDSMAVPLTPEMEERLRSYLQGRKAGSGSTDTYTRRHTEAMAMEAGLKLNDGTIRIPGNLRNES